MEKSTWALDIANTIFMLMASGVLMCCTSWSYGSGFPKKVQATMKNSPFEKFSSRETKHYIIWTPWTTCGLWGALRPLPSNDSPCHSGWCWSCSCGTCMLPQLLLPVHAAHGTRGTHSMLHLGWVAAWGTMACINVVSTGAAFMVCSHWLLGSQSSLHLMTPGPP